MTKPNPILRVVDGAAKLGLHPRFMYSRVMEQSFGIGITQTLEDFLKGREKVEKRKYSRTKWLDRLKNGSASVNFEEESSEVKNVFYPFVKKNTVISLEDNVSFPFFSISVCIPPFYSPFSHPSRR